MTKTYYDILEVSPTASKEEIKNSFRKLVRKFHPDVNKSPEAETIFKKINEALEVLSDDIKRLKYDHSINLIKPDTINDNKSDVEANFKKKEAPPKPKQKEKKSFSEVFNKFFDEKEKVEKKPEVKDFKTNGEDIHMTLEITSKEATAGVTKKVNIMHSEECPKCNGRKFINGARCTLCEGTGEKTTHKKVTITVPKNPKDGTVIRVAGEGKLGKFGGKNGELVITLKIKHSEIFKIEKDVAMLELPLSPSEAMLGADVKIPTLSGFTLMKIPPQTNSGQKFRILNAGVLDQKTGERGDLIVTAAIYVPQSPTIEEIKLYKELQKLDTSEIRKELFE